MKKFSLHFIFWLVFFFVWKQIGYFYMNDSRSAMLFTLFDAVSLAMPFYLIFGWVTPKFFPYPLKLRFSVLFLAAVVASGLLISLLMRVVLTQGFLRFQFNFSWQYGDLIFNRCFLVAIGGLSGFIIKLSLDWFQNRQRITQLEKENHVAELQSLKAQINPHFLFNTLNTIYIEMEVDTVRARTSLHALSHLLRYQLHEGNKDEVALQNEIDYLTNYVGLQKGRTEGVDITLDVSTAHQGLRIAPLIMITFVENAFKYVDTSTNTSQRVALVLRSSAKEIDFKIENTIGLSERQLPGLGTGLDNVKRRLQLLYPNRHTLHIRQTADVYAVHLKITLE